MLLGAVGSGQCLDGAAKADLVRGVRPRHFPGIAEGQPVLRILVLPAILDHLAEHAVVVADAVAVRGMHSVAMLSMKHAASRPSPPLPSAASCSMLRSRP